MNIIFLFFLFNSMRFLSIRPLTYYDSLYASHINTIDKTWYNKIRRGHQTLYKKIITLFADTFYPESLLITFFCLEKKFQYDKKNLSKSIIINFLRKINQNINNKKRNITYNSLFLLIESACYLNTIPNLKSTATLYCPEWFDQRPYQIDGTEYQGPNLTYNIILTKTIFDCYCNLKIFSLQELEILFKIIAIGNNIKKIIIDF